MRNEKNLKNFISLVLTAVIIIPSIGIIKPSAIFIPDVNVYSGGVYMINLDTDITIFSQNETERYYPASTTKIMTALLTLENVPNLDAFVEVPGIVMNEFDPSDPNKYGPSSADIRTGQTNVTYRDCLYALMISSACEAGNILAYNVGGGDMGNFISMMNNKANELGCVNTNFGNAHGLHQEDNYSSAYDMYLITKYAYDNYEQFMEICNTYEYDMPPNPDNPNGYTIYSTNKLITPSSELYYEYAKGIKTGSIDVYFDLDTGETTPGHSSFVSVAEKSGYTYMLVTLGAPYYDVAESGEKGNYHFKDHISLYKWAFSTFEYKTILTTNDIIATIPVLQGENADTVQLKPSSDYSTILPSSIDNSAILRDVNLYNQEINAPVYKGKVLGTVDLKIADETLTSITLVAADTIDLSQSAYVIGKIKDVASRPWFKAGMAALVALTITLSVLNVINKSKKAKKNNNKLKKRKKW